MPTPLTHDIQAARDCALRSRSGVFSYLIIFVVINLYTPYVEKLPTFVSIVGVIILLASLTRAIASVYIERVYRFSPIVWYVAMFTGITCMALSWSVLSAMSIFYFGWDWTTMLTCLSAAAFSAGAVVVFSIDMRLIIAQLVAMFFPVLVTMAWLNTQESLTSFFLFSIYFIFLVRSSQQINREYWDARHNANLLNQRAHELQVKNAELESFAYSVSHDLRTPLRAIDGYSKILLDDSSHKLSPDETSYLTRVRDAAQHMGRIIDDLLKLSRISRIPINHTRVNLSELVKVNVEKLRNESPERNVSVEIEPDIVANGDHSLLDAAIYNLLDNAWKYSAKQANAKIRFSKAEKDGKLAYFIKDNGAGFDVATSQSLFKPFHRLHTNEEFPGIGVGLAIVKRIFQRHGGDIWANAKVNKGATFYFTLG